MTKLRPSTQVYSILILALLVILASTACHKSEPATSNANHAATNTSASTKTATATPTVAEAKPAAEVPAAPGTISLATPTDTYKTAYAARKNKDIPTLKRVFAKDAIEFLTEMLSSEKKTLEDHLKELSEKPQAATAETRNEKINGNRATLEYLDEKGKWSVMDFSKEGNEWKIDLPKAN